MRLRLHRRALPRPLERRRGHDAAQHPSDVRLRADLLEAAAALRKALSPYNRSRVRCDIPQVVHSVRNAGKDLDYLFLVNDNVVTPLTDDPDMRDTLGAAVNTYF